MIHKSLSGAKICEASCMIFTGNGNFGQKAGRGLDFNVEKG